MGFSCGGSKSGSSGEKVGNSVQNSSAQVKENRSRIDGKVLDVTEGEKHNFTIFLKVLNTKEVAGFADFTKEGDTIKIHPFYSAKEGEAIDYSDEENAEMTKAVELQPNDEITAPVTYIGPGNKWLLMKWENK